MSFPTTVAGIAILVTLGVPMASLAAPPSLPGGEESTCLGAAAHAERVEHIPDGLLQAMALTESGRRQANRTLVAWPWTLNVDGQGLYLDSRAEAVAVTQRLQAQHPYNIDLGCLQISSRFHPNAFGSLQEAFDPPANAAYAARLLRTLFQQTGSWEEAVARYHSGNPARGASYRRRVFAVFRGDLSEAIAAAEQRERLQGPLLAAMRLIDRDPKAAADAFTTILAAHPDNLVALTGRALARQRTGNPASAYEDLVRLYRQTPNDRTLWRKIAQYLGSLPVHARIQHLETLAQQVPQDRRIQDWLVQECLAIGDDPRALRHKLALIQLSPTEPRLYRDAAIIAHRLGHRGQAQGLLEKALSLPATKHNADLKADLTTLAESFGPPPDRAASPKP